MISTLSDHSDISDWYLTQHLDYRHLILCALPCSIKNPNPLTCLLTVGLHTSRLYWPFPHPHMLTPTCSTAGLASQTKTPLQSAPSVLHLVRVFTTKTDWAPVVLLGSCLGIRSNKPVSHHTHSLPLLEILFPPACVDKRRSLIPLAHRQASSPLPSFVFPTLVSIRNHHDWLIPTQLGPLLKSISNQQKGSNIWYLIQ